ncbi:MAG TPA: LptA/OstA family protein [Verrucomicrobiae bacterium]|jgi:lipopolysaccharide export system protein LptA
MKKFPCLIFLAIVCGVAATLPAQTNTATNGVDSILALVTTNRPPAAPVTNQPPQRQRGPIIIKAAGPSVFDMYNHWVTYSENVRVTDPQMKLTCEWAKADFSENWSQATNIVAETNVVVDYIDPKGQKGRALGDKAVYLFQIQNGVTNETVTLTGNPPEIEQGPDYTNHLTGSQFVYDLMTGKMTAPNSTIVFWPGTNSPSGSNSQPQGNLPFAK